MRLIDADAIDLKYSDPEVKEILNDAKTININKLFKEFVKEHITFESTITVTLKDVTYVNAPEPFCPFIFSGYCNDAYSDKCYSCEHAMKDFLGVEDKY